FEDVERLIRRVPDPLGFVAIDRHGAFRQRVEVDTDDRKHLVRSAVPESAACELGAGEELFGDDRLVVGLEKEARLLFELVAIPNLIFFLDLPRLPLVYAIQRT